MIAARGLEPGGCCFTKVKRKLFLYINIKPLRNNENAMLLNTKCSIIFEIKKLNQLNPNKMVGK